MASGCNFTELSLLSALLLFLFFFVATSVVCFWSFLFVLFFIWFCFVVSCFRFVLLACSCVGAL